MTAIVRDQFTVPMDGDMYTFSARATDGQLWERIAPLHTASIWDGGDDYMDDPDLYRKQRIEDELAWGTDL